MVTSVLWSSSNDSKCDMSWTNTSGVDTIKCVGDQICKIGGVHCVKYKYIRESLEKHGARMPMHFECAWFLGGSVLNVEPKYGVEPNTRWEYL